MALRISSAALILALLLPLAVSAAVFGGQTSEVIFCVEGGEILAQVGPPRGGTFMWSPEIIPSTYRFGPPTHTGQWVIGLSAGVVRPCVVSLAPLTIRSGILMTMVGSSR